MKRYYSLKGRINFKELFFNGNIYKGKGIRIFVLKEKNSDNINSVNRSEPDKHIKIGISVNKKYGKANKRNLAKRRVKAICRDLLNEMESGYSLIISPGIHSKDQSYEELKEQIILLFKKAGILRK